jgi:hypothetical protein
MLTCGRADVLTWALLVIATLLLAELLRLPWQGRLLGAARPMNDPSI